MRDAAFPWPGGASPRASGSPRMARDFSRSRRLLLGAGHGGRRPPSRITVFPRSAKAASPGSRRRQRGVGTMVRAAGPVPSGGPCRRSPHRGPSARRPPFWTAVASVSQGPAFTSKPPDPSGHIATSPRATPPWLPPAFADYGAARRRRNRPAVPWHAVGLHACGRPFRADGVGAAVLGFHPRPGYAAAPLLTPGRGTTGPAPPAPPIPPRCPGSGCRRRPCTDDPAHARAA